MNKIIKKCLNQNCEKNFEADIREHKRGNALFCSLSCSSKRERKEKIPNLSCSFCDKEFYRPKSKIKSKSGFYFCCREHKDEAQKIENNFKEMFPSHYNKGESDYRKIAFKNKEKICERCGFDVFEVLEVHHKDRNRLNNDSSNLEILCSNCHIYEHFLKKDGKFKKK